MRHIEKASEVHEDFSDLIGVDITFASDIYSSSGFISHKKGEVAFISDVEYTPGYYSVTFQQFMKPKILSFKINGVPSISWRPDTFVEYKILK